MSPSPEAVAHQEARQRLATATALATHSIWRRLDQDNLYQSWLGLAGDVLAVVAGGQMAAAQMTGPWLNELLGPENDDRPGAGGVIPEAFAGADGAGRPLAGALMAPIWAALRLVTAGRPIVQALVAGRSLLDAIAQTAVADVGRAADSVAMTARPAVTGYIRVVEAGACSRCLILAGNEYQTDKAFLRHPRCNCGMEPVTRTHRPRPASPDDLVAQMSEEQKRKTFGTDAAKAINEGADLGQLVNARRGMSGASVLGGRPVTTTEGTVRGEFRRQEFRALQQAGAIPRSQSMRGFRPTRPRLMPEEIYRQAGDRQHAVRLLREHGYIA
ncbi:hypothetical protein OG331_23045 [Streptomyces sp. NBC_01017]|uniref:VG15 protein n=1 Tax=Streptomyces sp. NBC_01017 TaxID=2903721 RepID=UPI0038631C79|nr:hypothetical protein OG331_23045 [Streptomyces sp. NBC_01017]